MPRKIKLVLNPMADMGAAWTVARDLRPMIAEYGHADWSGTVYPTHATELARQAGEEGYDMVVAVGGDGTVHEVVNGLMQVSEDKRPILGVVPVGSGNDFAMAAGVPNDPSQALALALNGEASFVDLGLMTDENGRQEYFDNTVGIGFDAAVTIRSHKLPVVRGFLMYLTAVIQTIIMNFAPANFQVETDRESWNMQTLMLAVCNGPREGGGFMLAPEAKIDDGTFHYVTIRKVSRPMMFRLLPEVMQGTHARFEQVRLGTCKTLTIQSDKPLYIHTDGEIYASFTSTLKKVSFEVIPNALRVVRGAQKS